MSAKHTPGPWKAHWREIWTDEPEDIRFRIATVVANDDAPADERVHADAQLIAESPLLADALEAALLFHRGGPWIDDDAQRWRLLTGHSDATTKALCDCIRARLRTAGRLP